MSKSATPKDILDVETSASVEVTPTGASAKTKSRLVAAIDRLGGNLVDKWNIGLEKSAKVKRAKTDAEVKIVEALGDYAAKRIKQDPQFAERALNSHLKGIFDEQENLEAIIAEASEQLKLAPPQEDKPDAPEKLDDQFLNRFRSYAKEANTDELRQQWAKVLVAEVHKPGTFSHKVLRTIDEVDSATARNFQILCQNQLGQTIPKHTAPDFGYIDFQNLVQAGLMIDPGFTGQSMIGSEANTNSGAKLQLFPFSKFSLGFFDDQSQLSKLTDFDKNIGFSEERLSIKCYILTDIGSAISTIFANEEFIALKKLIEKIRMYNNDIKLQAYINKGDQFFEISV
jgi:Protein of unknown function (DUF2806)